MILEFLGIAPDMELQYWRKIMNIPLDEWSGSKATKDLENTIERIQKENTKQTSLMLVLTAINIVLALIATWPVIKACIV
jgi:mannose/fructose/N-acetylgalactosamine-specific phosphotransferase system component IIB